MARKIIYPLVAILGISVASGAAWWYQSRAKGPQEIVAAGATLSASAAVGAASGPAAPRAAGVEIARVEKISLQDDAQSVGSLRSRQSVMLRPEVPGRVRELGFTDGARVRKGQMLVQLDDTLQQAQLKQAEAQASIALTNLQRSRELLAQKFVSQSAVDQNAAALQVAEAQVALAQAQAQRMKVLAPFNGTAGLRAVDVGDYVKDGADIVNIEDLSSLTVRFALPERYVDRLRAGQAVDLSVDALPGKSFKGRVQAIDSQVDANGRALQVLAQVSNPGSVLRPGMFARPRVVFSVREAAVVVPEEALVPMGGKQYLFKVVDGPEGKKVSQRLEAKLGLRLPGKVEILGGVQAGDTLVTAGHGRLLRADSVPVRVIDLTQAAGSGKPGGAGGRPAGPASGASGARPAPAQP